MRKAQSCEEDYNSEGLTDIQTETDVRAFVPSKSMFHPFVNYKSKILNSEYTLM